MVRMRVLTAVAALAAVSLGLSACGGGGTSTTSGAAVPSAAASVDPNAIPMSLVGMHIEGAEAGVWASAPFGALRLWDNGTAWSQIELAKGEYKWDNLDGIIANAKSKGMNDILMVLGTTPEWAVPKKALKKGKDDYPQPGAASPPKDLKDWQDWVTAVVTRYKGQITAYEIWNEANLKQFYSGSPEELAEMTKMAYDIIKANDPDALVVAASPALRLDGRFTEFYPKYLEALAKDDWPVDVLSLHSYPAGNEGPAERGKLIQKYLDAVKADRKSVV